MESDEDIFGDIAASSAPRSGHGEVSEARRPDEEVAGSRAMQAAQPVQVGDSVSDEAADSWLTPRSVGLHLQMMSHSSRARSSQRL